MPSNVERALGRIEGKVDAIRDDIAVQHQRLNDHGKRTRRLEIKTMAIWLAAGAVAAVVAIAARDRGGVPLAFQLLVYPVTARDYETGSYQRNANGYSLTMDGMKWFWDHYLSNDADADNPYAAPMAAKDLSGLPPALVITTEFDPLCDEGEAYAQRLKAAGVSTTASRYDGMIHGFFGMSGVVDKAALAVAEAAAAMKKAFAATKAAAAR